MRAYSLLVILFLTGTSAFAWKNASERVDLSVNDDGTVNLSRPMFQEGQLHWLSIASSNSGVCKLFGFADYVQNTKLEQNVGLQRMIDINNDGNFALFRSSIYRLHSLSCQFADIAFNYDSKMNSDGVTTIWNLRIGNQTYARRLAASSDPRALCNRLGFANFQAMKTSGDVSSTNRCVKIGSDGQPAALEYQTIIESIDCF